MKSIRTIAEQDVNASPPQARRHKIYSPHGTQIVDADKEDTRAAETGLADKGYLRTYFIWVERTVAQLSPPNSIGEVSRTRSFVQQPCSNLSKSPEMLRKAAKQKYCDLSEGRLLELRVERRESPVLFGLIRSKLDRVRIEAVEDDPHHARQLRATLLTSLKRSGLSLDNPDSIPLGELVRRGVGHAGLTR